MLTEITNKIQEKLKILKFVKNFNDYSGLFLRFIYIQSNYNHIHSFNQTNMNNYYQKKLKFDH